MNMYNLRKQNLKCRAGGLMLKYIDDDHFTMHAVPPKGERLNEQSQSSLPLPVCHLPVSFN